MIWNAYFRQKAMGPGMDALKAVSFGLGTGSGSLGADQKQAGGEGNGDGPGNKKAPKPKPMSRRLSTSIATCSSKMTEILSWKSKLDENKTGMNLNTIKFDLENVVSTYGSIDGQL